MVGSLGDARCQIYKLYSILLHFPEFNSHNLSQSTWLNPTITFSHLVSIL